MKRNKFAGITALLPLVLFDLAALPVSAEVTDYQETEAGLEEIRDKCQVIYKSTYDFSETIPKYPELEVSASGYEGVYDGKPHGITVGCGTDGITVLYSTDGRSYTAKKPVYTGVGTYVTYYRVEKEGYTTAAGSAVVKIKEAVIDFASYDYNGIYDGRQHSIELSVRTGGCKVLYSEDGINFTSKKPEYQEPGTYVVCYKIMKDNHATVTGSGKVIIKEKDNTIKLDRGNPVSTDTASGNPDNISHVQTGDASHILPYGAMLIASVLGLVKNRSRKETENYEDKKTDA